MLARDVGHGRDQGLGRLVVVLASCAGIGDFDPEPVAKGEGFFLGASCWR
jgi:hypothetical protein